MLFDRTDRKEEKGMKKDPRAGILFLTIMMLWGIMYPQYALTEDMYETAKQGQPVLKDSASDYKQILGAKAGEVEIRFALLDQIEEWFGEKWNEDSGR